MQVRCPHCKTAFRVSAAQLAARAGRVRCGRCRSPFDAYAAQIISTRDAATPIQPAPLPHARGDGGPAKPAAPIHLDERYAPVRAPRSPLRRALGALLIMLLGSALALQLAFLFRTDIARELPALRPLLSAACARAGCTVPYPRDGSRLAIEVSDLLSEPGLPGRYLLRATLINRASHEQAWPHLELTLTDAGDRPVSRRTLTPAQWLPPGKDQGALPARAAIDVRLAFTLEGPAPTGYRLYALYP